jgi:hypothetical protein
MPCIFNFDFSILTCKIAKTLNILALNFVKIMTNLSKYSRYFSILIFIASEIARSHNTLAQNFGGKNAEFKSMFRVFSISILLFVTPLVAKTHILLAQNFGKRNGKI